MLTNITVLRVLQFIIFSVFTYLGIIVVERLMQRKVKKTWIYAVCALINSSLLYYATANLSIRLTFFLAFIVLVIEILIVFREKLETVLYGAMAIIINCMCLRGIISSIYAIISGRTFQEIYTDDFTLLSVSVITSIFELALVAVALRFAPLEKIHIFMKIHRQKDYMLVWMSACVVVMFVNMGVYTVGHYCPELHMTQLFFCLGLLISSYFTLIHSYSISKSKKIESKYQRLSQELVTQKQLQSVLMRGSVFSCEANLTKNLIISGPEAYMESFARANFDYDKWFEVFKYNIHPEDRDYFFSFAGRDRLIESFESGTEPPPFIYRRMDNGVYHWVKMVVRIFRDIETDDVFVYGYSFDVDAEMREKQELELRAMTDSLTKLLNRDTAESAIKAEIQKGSGALFIMDIDNFKDINDCMGHSVGDRVLIRTANRLKEFFGDDNIVGRLGGDEFMAYLKGVTDLEALNEKARQLLELLSSQPENRDEPVITLSIGVAPITGSGASFSNVYSVADGALYEAKYGGKNDFRVCTV